MERVDDEASLNTWLGYLDDRVEIAKRIAKPLRQAHGWQAFKYAKNFLEKMALASVGIEIDAKKVLQRYKNAEVWMAYITDINPKGKFTLKKGSHIEMSVPVISNLEASFQVHMGIIRGLKYLEEKKVVHSNVSIDLHGFIAKTMLKRDKNSKKKYFITQPLTAMANIMDRDLSRNHVRFYDLGGSIPSFYALKNPPGSHWLKTTGDHFRAADFSLNIFDKNAIRIFIIKKTDNKKKEKYSWFLETIGFHRGSLLFMAELDYLANLFNPEVSEVLPQS